MTDIITTAIIPTNIVDTFIYSDEVYRINISGNNAAPSGFSFLLRSNLARYCTPAVFLLFFCVLILVGNIVRNKARRKAISSIYQVCAAMLTIGLAALYARSYYTTGSVAISIISQAFIMTATVFILDFVKLSILDYSVLFSCFTSLIWLVGIDSYFCGVAAPALYIFVTLLFVYRLRLKNLNGSLFYIWFASLMIVVEGYFAKAVFNKIVTPLGYSLGSGAEKLVIWGIAVTIFISFNLVFVYAIKRLFQKRFDDINNMGKEYPKIERFFIYSTVAILVIMSASYYTFGKESGFSGNLLQAFDIFTLIAVIIQLSFLILIFRITSLKDNLISSAFEKQNLAAYSSGLEKSMDDIRDIKHDIKNLFLTMGAYVDQSENAEMQAYYREMISPYASGEIAKSDLFGKLAAIGNEQLKAFFYYKASQALSCGIELSIDITPCFSISDLRIGFTDLIRVLGILLDNAIEECIESAGSSLAIKLSRNDELFSFIIKNTVRQCVKEKGIRAGVSTKGGSRGAGLTICLSVLEKYDFITLNSYFVESSFVQNLVLYVSHTRG